MNNLQKIREEIRVLLLAEADKMRAIGATDADIQEDAFIEMVSQTVAKQMLKALRPDEMKEVVQVHIQSASPQELRNLAKHARLGGDVGAAYDLECLADIREMEG